MSYNERSSGGRSQGGRDGDFRGGRGGGRGGQRRGGGGGGRGRGGRGGGRFGGGRGGYDRGGSDRGGSFERNGGGRRFNNRRRSDPRQSSESGNQRERIAIESGFLVCIDQFMLANPQFIEKIVKVLDDAPEAKDAVIAEYGGTVLELDPGTFKIDRDPFACSIIVYPEGEEVTPTSVKRDEAEAVGKVLVDTRCIAMFDRELLDDKALLEKYQTLWNTGQDKACRDLLRDNGGAVRYGFSRYGDELGMYRVPDSDIVCLFPENMPVAESATEVVVAEPVQAAV